MVETEKSTASSGGSDNNNKSLHPAYSITNIHSKIKTLDGVKITYSAWVELFEIHVKAFRVSHHIDGTTPLDPTAEDYVAWSEVDSLVLHWIYNTLSDELMARVLAGKHKTARSAWLQVQSIFLNNKNARAAALTSAFTNLQLTACASLDAYCQKLQDLANQLGDVDHPVTESGLVLQLVRGLPKEYEVVGALINQQNPTWDVARNMLDLDLQRQSRMNGSSTALVTPGTNNGNNSSSPNNGNNRPTGYQGRNYDPNYQANRGRNSNYRGRGRGQRGRGRDGQQQQWSNNNNAGNNYWPSSQQSWAPPPSPYPTTNNNGPLQAYGQRMGPPGNNWAAPVFGPQYNQQAQFTNQSNQQAHFAGHQSGPNSQTHNQQFSSPGSQFSGYSEFGPSELAQTMQQVHLTSQDQNWYMDTGASSHLTSDPGSQDWSPYFPPQ